MSAKITTNAQRLDLPDGWSISPLGTLVTKLVDGSHNPPGKCEVGRPMLSARNITNNEILFDDYRFIANEEFAREHLRTNVSPGDVLLTIVGTIGRSAVVPEAKAPFTLQRSVAVMTPKGILPKFLMYQFQAPFTQRYFEAKARGTAQKGVYLKTLSETPIKVAPLSQQDTIVAEIEKQFSRLDEAVASLKRTKANLKRYKAAVLKAAIEGKLTEDWRMAHPNIEPAEKLLERIRKQRKEFEKQGGASLRDQPTLPERWTWTTVGQLGSVKGGKRLPAGHEYSSAPTAHPYIRVTDFDNYSVRKQDLRFLKPQTQRAISRYTIDSTDVYISIAGTIGLVGTVPKELDGANLTENAAKITDLYDTDPKYLCFALGSPYGQERVAASTIATTQSKLALFRIATIPLPLPSTEEQRLIVAEVERRLSVIAELEDTVEANLTRTDRLRQAVLEKAFNGQLV